MADTVPIQLCTNMRTKMHIEAKALNSDTDNIISGLSKQVVEVIIHGTNN